MLYSLQYPPIKDIANLEGKGNFAVSKYYQWPFRPFYRYKFKMVVDMMRGEHYSRLLDFGAGSRIFKPELLRHANFVSCVDKDSVINPLWRFNAIVCASVLEFTHLYHTLSMLQGLMHPASVLYVASPMDSLATRWYFKLIKDSYIRHPHGVIKQAIEKYFIIKEYKEWMGLYFALKAVKR